MIRTSETVRSEQIPGGCRLTYGSDIFTDIPVIVLTPIGGDNPTRIVPGRNADGTWFNEYNLSAPTLVTFIASQISR